MRLPWEVTPTVLVPSTSPAASLPWLAPTFFPGSSASSLSALAFANAFDGVGLGPPPLVLPDRPLRDLSGMLQTSASRVEDFRLCRRRWGFNAIEGVPRSQNAAAALGDEVHKLRERYLLEGIFPTKMTKAGTIALVGIDALPPPRVPLVEQIFAFTIPITAPGIGTELVEFRGRIDFLCRNDGVTTPYFWGEPGIPLVGDHKTTSQAQYVKTAEYLTSEDPQGAIYGLYGIATSLVPNTPAVDLHWSYMIKSSPPRPRQVYARATSSQVEESFSRVAKDAQEMLTLVRIKGIRAVDLEPNLSACEKFGGCPYKSICPLTDQQRFGAYMSSDPQQNFAPAQFAPQGNQQMQQPQFAMQQQQQQPQFPGADLNSVLMQQPPVQQNVQPQFLQGAPPPPRAMQAAMPMGVPQTPPTQIDPSQVQLPPGVTRDGAGALWVQQNGQWAPYQAQQQQQQQQPSAPQTQQLAPPQQGPVPTPQELAYAAQLVTQQQPVPANATPGTVSAYAAFMQQPTKAGQYLQALHAHQNLQAQQPQGQVAGIQPQQQQQQQTSAPPAQGIVPPDAPPVAQTNTTPEPGTGGRKKKDPAAPSLKQTQATELTASADRIATALEGINKSLQEIVALARIADPQAAASLAQQAAQLQPQTTQFVIPNGQQPQFDGQFQQNGQQPQFVQQGNGQNFQG